MEYIYINRTNFNNYLSEIESLYKDCFGKLNTDDYFKWRYLNNPYDDIQIIVAINASKLVSFYAVSPRELLFKNQTFKTAISLNTMTHPDYRGRGLFVTLADKLYKNLYNQGYEMVWGYPNNISHRTFISKLQWNNIYEIPTLENNIGDINIDKISCKKKFKIVNDNSFNNDYDKLSLDASKFIVNKDSSVLKRRYYNNPNNEYINYCIIDNNAVSSFIVAKKYNDQINIIDYIYKSKDEFFSLFNKIINLCYDTDIKKVTLWNSIDSDLRNDLEKLGFYNNYPIRYFGGRLLNTKISKDDFLNWNNWMLSMGDNNEY